MSVERWDTRAGLILAMAGNAVGLGNFLRFPAQAAQNGGGAFLIPYLICFVVLGIPLLWVEWAIGRHGGMLGHNSPPGMFEALGARPWFRYVGVLGLFTPLAVAAYYTYIESWTLAYVWHSLIGTFSEIAPGKFFQEFTGTSRGAVYAVPIAAGFWFLVTAYLNVWILSRGLARGIEIVAKFALPMLIFFGAVLVVRGLTLGPGDPGVIEDPLVGLNFTWDPQLSGLTNPTTWMAAAGQIFFTLSLGMGSIHCYASYLRPDEDIALNAATAGWLNEFVEVVLGGSLILPIATAYLGLQAVTHSMASGGGFALGFLTLPTLFSNWGWFAPLAGAMWFGLLFLAGITSSLAMGQPFIAFLQSAFGWTRSRSAAVYSLVLVSLGFFCVVFYPGGAFDEFDFWTGTFCLVVFALAEVVIFGHVFGIERGWREIIRGAEIRIPGLFRFVIRWVTPAMLAVILVGAVVKPSLDWIPAFTRLFGEGSWSFAPDSVVGHFLHVDRPDYQWFDPGGSPTSDLVRDISRLLLLFVFIGLCLLDRARRPERQR